MLKRGLAALLIGASLGGPAESLAQSRHVRPYEDEDLQITKLFCAIREGRLLTFFEFKMQTLTDHPELTGEISNYQVQLDGTRKYLSGLIFTHIGYNNLRAQGDTGDPTDLIGRFTLSRLDTAYGGRWSYEFHRSEIETVHAIFNCTYNDTPPSERRRRWPR